MRRAVIAALLAVLPAAAFADDVKGITLTADEYQTIMLTLIRESPAMALLYQKQLDAQAAQQAAQQHPADKPAQPTGK